MRDPIIRAADSLLEKTEQDNPPISLLPIARLQHICEIQLRPMLIDGGTQVIDDGFRVYLHNATVRSLTDDDVKGLDSRQRFSLAHEIVHTLFFDLSSGTPILKPGSPKGPKLEKLCNIGARRILVPERMLRKLLKGQEPISLKLLRQVCDNFKVSLHVVLRQIQEFSLTGPDQAFLLAETQDMGDDAEIVAATYHTSFLSFFERPRLYSSFKAWAKPLGHQDLICADPGAYCLQFNGRELEIKKEVLSDDSFTLELSLR